MKLVTVATHSERYYPYLKLSAKAHGHDLITLGWGEKWKGFGWKFQLMRDYLNSLKSDELICFIDGYDVIVLQSPDTIESNYREITNGDKSSVVISTEVSADQIVNYWATFFSYKCKGYLVNTGTYIGYSSVLIEIFNDMCTIFECKSDSDDQILLQKYCIQNEDKFVIDNDMKIFLVVPLLTDKLTSGKHDIEIKDKTLHYKKSRPCILHAPAYTDIDDIIVGLGYDGTIFQGRNEDKTTYRINFIKHFIKEIYYRYFIFINILLVILFIFILQKFNIINIKSIYRRTIKLFPQNKGR